MVGDDVTGAGVDIGGGLKDGSAAVGLGVGSKVSPYNIDSTSSTKILKSTSVNPLI